MSKFVPESVLEKLVVGQRVRYDPPAECDKMPEPSSYSDRYGATGHEPTTNAAGKVGTIIYMDNVFPGHPYEVRMDEDYEFGGRMWSCVTAAADELALVEDES